MTAPTVEQTVDSTDDVPRSASRSVSSNILLMCQSVPQFLEEVVELVRSMSATADRRAIVDSTDCEDNVEVFDKVLEE